jgi:hypothetical protein
MSDEEASGVTNKPGCVMKHWGGELFVYIAAGKNPELRKERIVLTPRQKTVIKCQYLLTNGSLSVTNGPPGTSIHKL